jgi:hypothetical protein
MLQSLKAMTVEDVWISVAVWTVVIVLAATSVAFLVSGRIWVLTVSPDDWIGPGAASRNPSAKSNAGTPQHDIVLSVFW